MRDMRTRTRRSRSRQRRGAVSALTAVAVGVLLNAPATTAEAADPIVSPGDILIASFGDLVTSAGVDNLDPVTGEVTDAASLGILDATTHVAAAPNGDFFAANLEGDIVRVDHLTGEQTQIRKGFNPGSEFSDMVVGADGNLLAVLNEQTGPSVVRIDAQSGRIVFELADDGLLDFASEIAKDRNRQRLGRQRAHASRRRSAQRAGAGCPGCRRGRDVRRHPHRQLR